MWLVQQYSLRCRFAASCTNPFHLLSDRAGKMNCIRMFQRESVKYRLIWESRITFLSNLKLMWPKYRPYLDILLFYICTSWFLDLELKGERANLNYVIRIKHQLKVTEHETTCIIEHFNFLGWLDPDTYTLARLEHCCGSLPAKIKSAISWPIKLVLHVFSLQFGMYISSIVSVKRYLGLKSQTLKFQYLSMWHVFYTQK